MSGLDPGLEPITEVRRIEVINGAMGRRRWSSDDRTRILEETLAPGAVVSAVARRYGLAPQQLFTWRREARKRTRAGDPLFVPAVIVAEPEAAAKEGARSTAPRRRARRRASIELEVAGAVVRIDGGAAPETIAAVIRALRAPA